MPKFYSKSMRVARKAHKCYECGNKIEPGTRYENVSAKWEEGFEEFKTCPKCLELRDYTICHGHIPCLCWSHGSMIDDCIETLKEYAHELPGMLFGGYRLLAKIKGKSGSRNWLVK
jgi:hypothetical protein